MELSTVFNSDTLKAADLQGREHTVVIATVELKEFNDGNKLVLSFQGAKKTMVCNKTNANRIAYMHGTNTDGWIGKEITLYPDLVDFQGKTVEAIRVRPPVARAAQPARNGATPIAGTNYQARPAAGVTMVERRPPQTENPAPAGGNIRSDMDDPIPFAAEWR